MPITLLNNNNNMQSRYAGIFSFNVNPWWLPIGIFPSNVIAAYQFKGADSEADALLNQNDTATYPLAKVGGTVTWNQANGFYIPATNGYGLNNASITSFTSVIARFSDVASGNSAAILVSPAAGYSLMAKAAYDNGGGQYRNAPGIIDFTTNPGTGYYMPSYYGNGVLAWNRPSRLLYINGVSQSLTGFTNAYITNPTYILIGQGRTSSYISSLAAYNLQAVAFYNTQLTAAQVVAISNQMASL
jgi:hypothetical protein